MSKALRLEQITIKHQDSTFFTVFLTIKTSSQNISIKLLQVSLKPHETSRRLLEEKAPVNDFRRTVPSAREILLQVK